MHHVELSSDPRQHIGQALMAPTMIYERYLAAVAQRDLDAVLALASEDYGSRLRAVRERSSFDAFFGLWCENYPPQDVVIACCIDHDSAVLETVAECEGGSLPGSVTLVHDGASWRVHAERCADGRTRMPIGRLARCRLS